MDAAPQAARRLPWKPIATALTLLAIQATAAHAQAPAPMPTVVYPSGLGQGAEASSTRSRDGTYWFDTAVNGATLQMVFDTGASVVALRAEDASKAGIDTDQLAYNRAVMTANGKAEAAAVTLSTLSVGGITRHNVQALVGRPGALHANLMGQSFLAQLAGFKRDGDRIILQDK